MMRAMSKNKYQYKYKYKYKYACEYNFKNSKVKEEYL